MIRLVFLLRRCSYMDQAEFHEYWLRRHGPLVASHQQALGIRRYVQTHRVESVDPVDRLREAWGISESLYDGVAELWYDSEEAMLTNTSPSAREAAMELLEDERSFIDLPASPLWLATSVQLGDEIPKRLYADHKTKVNCFLRPSSDHALDDACERWLGLSHPVCMKNTVSASLVQSYTRLPRFESRIDRSLTKARSTDAEPYMGHEELYFQGDLEELMPFMIESSELKELASYLDLSSLSIWSGTEHVIIESG